MDEGHLLLKKNTFHLGKSFRNIAAQLNLLRFIMVMIAFVQSCCLLPSCTSQYIMYHHITHMAQNTHYVLSAMQKYLQYINKMQFLDRIVSLYKYCKYR